MREMIVSICSHTQILRHLLFVVWVSVGSHLQQEVSGTLRIESSILSDTFSKGQSRARGNAAYCIYIFFCLNHSVFRLLLNPVMPSYSYQSCSPKQFQFPTHVTICFLTVLSHCVKSILILKPSQAVVLDSTGWMRVLFQTGKICNLNRATGWLEQQEKSSEKQVAKYFLCGGSQNSDLSE